MSYPNPTPEQVKKNILATQKAAYNYHHFKLKGTKQTLADKVKGIESRSKLDR